MNRIRTAIGRHQLAVGFAAGLVIAGTVAGTGAALAAIPSTSTKLFNACVNKSTGAVRVIDYQAGKRCVSKTERSVAWGARGAVGPTGPTGAPGAPGAQGAPGVTGAPGAPATSLWAEADPSGTLVASSGGVTVGRVTNGWYIVTFPTDISHCATLGSGGGVPVFTSTGAVSNRQIGFIVINQYSGGTTFNNGGQPTANSVVVESFRYDGTQLDNAFRVAVFC